MNPDIKIENGNVKMTIPRDYEKAEFIIEMVCDAYNIKVGQIRAGATRDEIVIPRHVAMYLIKDMTRLTLKVNGMYFSRDHSTVSNSHKLIGEQRQVDKKLDRILTDLTKIVNDRFNL